MNKVSVFSIICIVAACLSACSSSGPATSFYALSSPHQISSDIESGAIGVVPVVLPEYLDNIAIVSRENRVSLNVSGRHAWAESLDKGFNRVLAANLSYFLEQGVVSFPWDQRDRPQKQLRVVIEAFDGVRGGEVNLTASWSVFDIAEKSVVGKGRIHLQSETSSGDYLAYINALNTLAEQFAEQLASKLSS